MKRLLMDKKSKGLHTFLGEGSEFQGTIKVPHSIRIDGNYKGKIETDENITIGPNGYIEADIIAKSANIGGFVKGNITVEGSVILEDKSTLIGNLTTGELMINEGAKFHGNCSMPSIKDVGE
jgi:cytoskeletal protein CcmA (bactofilin family)